jgi:hypothetical protein
MNERGTGLLAATVTASALLLVPAAATAARRSRD